MTAPSRLDARPSSFVRRARVALVVLAAWLAFSAVQLSIAAAVSQAGEIKWDRDLLVDLTMAVYWCVATAPIACWHRHLRRTGRSAGLLLLMHLPLLMLVTLGDTLTTRLSMRVFMGALPSAPFVATLTYFADFDTLSYLAVVIVTDAVLTLATVRAEEARALRLETLLARARLEYLEAQLQPHFLFNALGAVSELAYEAPASALRVLRQLALIFRRAW